MNRPLKNAIFIQSRYAPRWTTEEIKRFIKTRIKFEPLFDDRLYSTQEVWEKVAAEAKIPENWRRLKKKWSNLIYKYRKIHFEPNQNTPAATTWPFYELIHNYESQRRDSGSTCKVVSHEDTNSDDYQFMESTNYIIEEEPRELRTYKRIPGSQHKKQAAPESPLLRIDQSIFKDEPVDIDSDPMVFKIEEDSDAEVFELIPSPKQDYPSDPVEYETYDENQDAVSPRQISAKPHAPIPNVEKPHTTNKEAVNEESNKKHIESESTSLHGKTKKRKYSTFDEGETKGERKIRREITKCTNVFLKFMKMKYGIDPDPTSSESDTD